MDGSIVCGVDGSAESRSVLRVAAQLSGQLGAPLVIAHVTQTAYYAPEAGSFGTPLLEPLPHEVFSGEVLLEQIAEEEGLSEAKLQPLYGLPAERLAELAARRGKWGTAAAKVARTTHCSFSRSAQP